ncbi:hypothetical protein [Bosea sp. (in: a-proteobacteria)]|uniref:hypothetical protein n=1 Tax=Bosea sp. (in: a-proteobacteria) TaxID=1871050 RepID=UPI003566616A
MQYLHLSVSTADIANELDGEALADVFAELGRDGPLDEHMLREFAENLDTDGRCILLQLANAVTRHDEEAS